MAVCNFRFIPANKWEQSGCSSGSRSDKTIQKENLTCGHGSFFFFYLRVLLSLKAPVVIGFTVVALYVEVGKGCHRL